jgi:hypothetical protein
VESVAAIAVVAVLFRSSSCEIRDTSFSMLPMRSFNMSAAVGCVGVDATAGGADAIEDESDDEAADARLLSPAFSAAAAALLAMTGFDE